MIFEASGRRVGGLLDDFRRLVDRLCLLDGSHQFVADQIVSYLTPNVNKSFITVKSKSITIRDI